MTCYYSLIYGGNLWNCRPLNHLRIPIGFRPIVQRPLLADSVTLRPSGTRQDSSHFPRARQDNKSYAVRARTGPKRGYRPPRDLRYSLYQATTYVTANCSNAQRDICLAKSSWLPLVPSTRDHHIGSRQSIQLLISAYTAWKLKLEDAFLRRAIPGRTASSPSCV